VLLLDTHVWLWNIGGDARRLGRRAKQLLSRAGSQEAILISPVTLFEVAALHAAGRLHLTHPPEQWIREALHAPGARLADFSAGMAVDAGALTRTALPDPLDRMLVATARQLGATFLTADTRVLAYARDTGNVRVHDAGR
jgi:PIN domain nuclease of toxin-antitoxin system